MSSTKLVFVRHGESEKNVLKLNSCTVDKWPLTEKGKKNAQHVADRLKKMGHFDVILSSPVLRTRQTAAIISEALNLPVEYEDSLKEYQYGSWNDLTNQDLAKKFPEYREYKKYKRGSKEHFNYKLGGAESRADVVRRIRQFLEMVVKKYPGKNVLLVSHGGINSAIAKVLDNISFETYADQELIGYEDIETFYT